MLPRAKGRHLAALLLLGAAAVLVAVMAMREKVLEPEQVNQAVSVVRALHPELYAQDPVFGASGLWEPANPLWQGYLRGAYLASGQANMLAPFVALAGPLTFVYLLGMYLLIWRECGSWSVACLAAVLSLRVIDMPGGGHWGLGPLATVAPTSVYLAVTPWLVLALVSSRHWWSVPWVFLAAGLAANVSLSSGLDLTLVLAGVYLGQQRFAPRAWAVAALGGLCALGGASPALWHFVLVRAGQTSLAGGAGAWSAAVVALRRAGLAVLYPRMLLDVLELFPFVVALGLPAIIVLVRTHRFRSRQLGLWGWMLAACAVVGLGFEGLSQVVGYLLGRPPTIVFVEALRLALVPLYVLFAQAAVQLLRVQPWRVVFRWALVVMALAWMIPADNLAVPRHWVERAVASTMSPENRPQNVQRRILRQQGRQELQAIARWVRANTPASTVVVAGEPGLRLWSRRALVACPADLPYFYYLAPNRLEAWVHLVQQQDRLLNPPQGQPASPAALDAFARRHGAQFVVLRVEDAPAAPSLFVPPSPAGAWGRQWRLYRVAAAAEPGATLPAPASKP